MLGLQPCTASPCWEKNPSSCSLGRYLSTRLTSLNLRGWRASSLWLPVALCAICLPSCVCHWWWSHWGSIEPHWGWLQGAPQQQLLCCVYLPPASCFISNLGVLCHTLAFLWQTYGAGGLGHSFCSVVPGTPKKVCSYLKKRKRPKIRYSGACLWSQHLEGGSRGIRSSESSIGSGEMSQC